MLCAKSPTAALMNHAGFFLHAQEGDTNQMSDFPEAYTVGN